MPRYIVHNRVTNALVGIIEASDIGALVDALADGLAPPAYCDFHSYPPAGAFQPVPVEAGTDYRPGDPDGALRASRTNTGRVYAAIERNTRQTSLTRLKRSLRNALNAAEIKDAVTDLRAAGLITLSSMSGGDPHYSITGRN